MRYHHEKPAIYEPLYGEIYICDHPIYDRCTLYIIGKNGLAVIQQRCKNKHTYWTEIDPWLVNDLYLQKGFKSYFDQRSGPCEDGLYPTVTIRQIMWALRMKPLPKKCWETAFDHQPV